MKLLCTLLSIYVMLISSVACKDGNVLEKSKTQIVFTQGTDHAETPSDLCSPFCTCTCCVGFTKAVITAVQPIILVPSELAYPVIVEDLLKSPHDLFQPPKGQA